jgi:parvulin-like peptidyl-prolyl isomerase
MKKILLVFILCLTILKAQDENVATVGNIKISKQEFLERYELSPVLGKENIRNEIGAKYSLLYSIIAEKLWALEAEKNKIDTSKSVLAPINIIEKLYVKDALYKKEILDKINISENEINAAASKFVRKLKLKYIFSEDEKDINNKYYLLSNGYSFDSLYSALVKTDNTREIEFGMLEENVQDAVYKLPVGGFTKPLFWNNGYYIFYLVSDSRQLFIDTKGKNNTIDLIKTKLKDRKADILKKEYTAKLFKNITAKSDKKLIDTLAKNIFEILKDKTASKDTNGTYYSLTEKDGLWLEIYLKDYLNNDFIQINNTKIKLEKFIDDLTFFGLRVENKDILTITLKLNQRVKQFIEDELLALEGYKQGLAFDPEVKRQVKMWKDNYLFQVYRSKFNFENFKAIKDSLIAKKEDINYYNKIYDYLVINFVDISQAEDIFNNIENKNIDELKKYYESFNSIFIEEKTESETNIIPEIKDALITLHPNEVYGPITSKTGYKIIKLLQIKEDSLKANLTDNKQIEEYAKNLAGENIVKTTAIWAKKYGISINDELLKSLKVTRINSYIIKMFGFGGRIGAVPITPPFYKWVEEYKKLKEDSL